MHTTASRLRRLALGVGATLLAFSGWAVADPPERVARLSAINGPVSFSSAGQDDWDQATMNRPLTTGDRLWSDAGGRAEIQAGGALVRMDAGTGVSVLNLDERIVQLQLTQGSLHVRVRRLEPNQVFEVDTPNLAFTLRRPGEYRIEVDPDGNATTIVVRRGQGEAYGDGAAYVVDSRQPYRFTGTHLRDYRRVAVPHFDDFDRWTSERDRRYDASVSARYVSPDVVGALDLDTHGTWRVDASYGNVWVPDRVAAGWAPYSDGHWAWVAPWGWTWVDNAPWGFAVSHYGRWANLRGTWGWVPGPMRMPAVYAPALVAFIGGNNFQLTISSGPVGAVAWFPLAPREVYRPSYVVSRGYYERVNRSNTIVNNTVINNTYNTTNVTNIVYANRKVPGAVVAVPTAAFVQSQPVSKAAVRVSSDTLERAPVAGIEHVAPTASVRGAARRGDQPPARVFERSVMAHTAPPALPTPMAARPASSKPPVKPGGGGQQHQVGNPVPAAAPPGAVQVIAPPQAAAPTRRPPTPATVMGSAGPRDVGKERKADSATASPAAARAADAAPQAAIPTTRPQEPRARSEPQRKDARREAQVAAPTVAPPAQPVAPVKPVPAAAVQTAPSRPQQPNQLSPKPTAATAPDTVRSTQPATPEPARTGRQAAEPRPPVAAAKAPASSDQPAPQAQARAPESRSASDKANGRGHDGGAPKRDENERKPTQ